VLAADQVESQHSASERFVRPMALSHREAVVASADRDVDQLGFVSRDESEEFAECMGKPFGFVCSRCSARGVIA
jgi:hypothetical protein